MKETNKPNIDLVIKDDEVMFDWYMEQLPLPSKEETKKEIEYLNKCADIILKSGISCNLDSIY